ncbi:MAG: type II toxin-antitoxin system RelE/ParE family toxin [Thermoanaerobaculia bacterium]
MSRVGKPLAWLHGEVRTPPLSTEARIEMGRLLRRLQRGELLPFPESRPMNTIGKNCHELRLRDEDADWRLIYAVRPDAVVVLDVFPKKSNRTPREVLSACRSRIRRYDETK